MPSIDCFVDVERRLPISDCLRQGRTCDQAVAGTPMQSSECLLDDLLRRSGNRGGNPHADDSARRARDIGTEIAQSNRLWIASRRRRVLIGLWSWTLAACARYSAATVAFFRAHDPRLGLLQGLDVRSLRLSSLTTSWRPAGGVPLLFGKPQLFDEIFADRLRPLFDFARAVFHALEDFGRLNDEVERVAPSFWAWKGVEARNAFGSAAAAGEPCTDSPRCRHGAADSRGTPYT